MPKLLGGLTDASAPIFSMTQGLGYPLRGVDQLGNPDGQIIAEEVLRVFSNTTQNPTAVNTPLVLNFGAATSNAFFSVSAGGVVTCNTAGSYEYRLRLVMGRSTTPGDAILFARALVNGVQAGQAVSATSTGPNVQVPLQASGNLTMAAGSTLSFEINRDSAGVNDGGVYARTSSIGAWGVSPSTQLIIVRYRI